MSAELSEISPGLFVRTSTPRDVLVTDEFLRQIIHESESSTFERIIVQVAKQRNAAKSRRLTGPGK